MTMNLVSSPNTELWQASTGAQELRRLKVQLHHARDTVGWWTLANKLYSTLELLPAQSCGSPTVQMIRCLLLAIVVHVDSIFRVCP